MISKQTVSTEVTVDMINRTMRIVVSRRIAQLNHALSICRHSKRKHQLEKAYRALVEIERVRLSW